MTIRLPNPKRGCGTKKKGGFYLEGSSSSAGRLRRWTWLLGMGTERCGGANYYCSIPPRSHQIGGLGMTLAAFRPVLPGMPEPNADHLPTPAMHNILNLDAEAVIFDHVGKRYYPDPYTFFREVYDHGPSRRVTPAMAILAAKHAPLPILFSHPNMPVVGEAVLAETLAWLKESYLIGDDLWTNPTPWQSGWGLYAENVSGGDHWLTGLLYHLSGHGFFSPGSCRVPPRLVENILTAEQFLGLSWITRVTYVIQDDDPPDKLDAIAASGIILGEI